MFLALISLFLKSWQPIKLYYSHWIKIQISRPTLVGIFLAGLEQNLFFEIIDIPYQVTIKKFRPLPLMVMKLQAFKVYYSHWSKMCSYRPALVGWWFDFNSSVLSTYYVIPVQIYYTLVVYGLYTSFPYLHFSVPNLEKLFVHQRH